MSVRQRSRMSRLFSAYIRFAPARITTTRTRGEVDLLHVARRVLVGLAVGRHYLQVTAVLDDHPLAVAGHHERVRAVRQALGLLLGEVVAPSMVRGGRRATVVPQHAEQRPAQPQQTAASRLHRYRSRRPRRAPAPRGRRGLRGRPRDRGLLVVVLGVLVLVAVTGRPPHIGANGDVVAASGTRCGRQPVGNDRSNTRVVDRVERPDR